MFYDRKKLSILRYLQNRSQDFSTSLKRLKDSVWYIQADSSSTVLVNCFYWVSTVAGTSAHKLINVHGILLQFQFLAYNTERQLLTAEYHEQVNYTKNCTATRGLIWRWRYWHQAPGFSNNANFISERQGLKSCKKWKKRVFIHSHTQEHWIGFMSDRSMTKGNINQLRTLAFRWEAVINMWEVSIHGECSWNSKKNR